MHTHPGPPSTSAYGAGCRDPRCRKAFQNWERLRNVAKATAKPVSVQPTPAQITTPEPSLAASEPPQAASVPEQLVPTVEVVVEQLVATTVVPVVVVEDDLGRSSIFDAVRILRVTAGVA